MLTSFAFAVCLASGLLPQEETPTRPNIVLILVDDLGYGDLAVHGNQHVRTPSLDALAGESARLTDFHVAPTCSPSRASLLTGRHYLRTGVWGIHGGREYLDPAETTLAEALRSNDYATALIGKWHLGESAGYLPEDQGFEEVWHLVERIYRHIDPVIRHGSEQGKMRGSTPEVLTQLAIDYLEREHASPFFLYLAYPEIHTPWIAPKAFEKAYRQRGLSPNLARIDAMIEQIDQSVGLLVGALDRLELREDTLVVFTSDSGSAVGSNPKTRLTAEELELRNPLGLRGHKGSVFEGGTRVPCFLSWPGRIEARSIAAPTDGVDLWPTLLDAAGAAFEAEDVDGIALTAALAGAQLPERALFSAQGVTWSGHARLYEPLGEDAEVAFDEQQLAIRRGRDKLVRFEGKSLLFDLESDAGELNDLSEQEPERARRLLSELKTWFSDLRSEPAFCRRPMFYIGHEGWRTSLVPAYAPSSLSGNVTPGSTFSAGWVHSGDGQKIDVEVLTAGRYLVEVELAARTEEPAVLELLLQDARLRINLAGRTSRHLLLGQVELEAGPAELRLALLKPPGELETPVIDKLFGLRFRPR